MRADLLRDGDVVAALGARRLPDGVDGRRVGLAEGPRRDGEGHARRADPRGGAPAARPPASRSASSCSSATRARRGTTSRRRWQLVRECEPDDIGVSVSYPLPGTQFYERVRAELGEKQNWFDSDDLAMMYEATYATEFYRVLHARRAPRVPRARQPSRHLRSLSRRPLRTRAWDLPATWRPDLPPRRIAAGRTAARATGAQTRHGPVPRDSYRLLTRRRRRCRPGRSSAPVAERPRRLMRTRPRSCSTTRARCSTRCRWRCSRWRRRSIAQRYEVVIIDGRLEADPMRPCSRPTDGALCLGVTRADRRADPRRARGVAAPSRPPGRTCTVVWGGWHPSLFAAECSGRAGGRYRRHRSGRGHVRRDRRALTAGESVVGCAGTQCHGEAGIVAGPPRPLADLNKLRRTTIHSCPVERYFALKGQRQIDYISSQGCRFRCAFCADPAVYHARLDRTGARAHRRRGRCASCAAIRWTSSRSRTRRSSRIRRDRSIG